MGVALQLNDVPDAMRLGQHWVRLEGVAIG